MSLFRVCPRVLLGWFLLSVVFFGRLDAGEAASGKIPADSGGLIRFGFEALDAGLSPTWEVSDGVTWVEGYRGRAPHISEGGSSVLLPFKSGQPIPIDLVEGSLRFRFRPDWSTGKGPGHWASFVSLGEWTPDPPTIGSWALGVDPTGTQIMFSAQAVGSGKTFLRVPFKFQEGRWYDLLLVYSPASSVLYVDGAQLGPGGGVTVGPSEAVQQTYGLRLGNNHRGNQPIRGAIDEFEFSTEQRTGFIQRRDRYAIEAVSREQTPSVTLRWNGGQEGSVPIRRRRMGDVDWQEMSSSASLSQFVDRSPDLRVGEAYEYAINDQRIAVNVGIRGEVEDRGRVLLVVADDVASGLAKSIEQFRSDLIGDGWLVESDVVPPHDMRRRSRYRRRVAEVKSLVEEFYRPAPNRISVIILIGNVPIPYSGFRAEDGHRKEGDDHRGAWPCDAYYGDIDGIWTDETVDHINLTHRGNSNRPGDGKFDQDYLPSPLELAVCRIDFSNLPAIAGGHLPDQPRRVRDIEIGLLRQYFEKNHRYRFGRLSFEKRAVYKSYLPSRLWGNMDRNAFRNSAVLFGLGAGAVSDEDCFLMASPVRWAFIAGYGGRESIGSGRYQTPFLNQAGFGPQAAFIMLYASWSGDWNLRNSFTKSMLVKPHTGLAAMSSIHGQWNFMSLGLGEPLARGLLQTTIDAGPQRWVARSISLLGDATLRMDIVPPVSGLKGELVYRQVRLSWNQDDHESANMGCFVYRSKHSGGPYRRISGEHPVRSGEFIDTEAISSEGFYMVRRVGMESTPSGQYVNLSQGQFWKRPKE